MFLKSPLKKERGRERGGDCISQSKTKMSIFFSQLVMNNAFRCEREIPPYP